MSEEKPPEPPMSKHEEMLALFFQQKLRERVRLMQVRSPKGLAGLFPGLGKRKR